jgi:hypothetical protein
MKDEHIVSIVESKPFANLSEVELQTINSHAAGCDSCRRAFEAARISSLLISERVAQEVEPSPFFQTRVMAALRERQAASEPALSGLWRLWKATGALVSSMAATVAMLAVFTFYSPATESTAQEWSESDVYSAEEVILVRDDDLSYDQVLTTVYESELDAER